MLMLFQAVHSIYVLAQLVRPEKRKKILSGDAEHLFGVVIGPAPPHRYSAAALNVLL